MTAHLDLSERRYISREWSSGEQSQRQVTVSGVIKLIVQDKGKAAGIRIKDVMWVLELPCQLLSTGATRKLGGDFVHSEFRKSHIILRKDGPKVESDERDDLMTLQGSVEQNNAK